MNVLRQSGKSVISRFAAATLALAAGVFYLSANAASEPFTGTATLCAVNPFGVTSETKGKNGITYEYNMVFVYRIETDESSGLMRGWEVLTSNSKLSSAGSGFYWGVAVLTPDEYAGTGTLVDNFEFKAKDAASISSTYVGTGALEGVSVDFQLTLDPAPAFCSEVPPQCGDGTMPCIPVCEACEPPFNQPFGYLMNGSIN